MSDSALDELLYDLLVEDGLGPERAAEIISDASDISSEKLLKYIQSEYSLTEGPGRHSFDYCLLCNPELNGSHGKDGTEAIAKYKVRDERDVDQHFTGWVGVCEDCAYGLQASVSLTPLPGHEDHDLFQTESESVVHECQNPTWTKVSLVTESGGYDIVQCDECGIYAKRHGIDSIEVVGYDRPR